LDMTLREQPSCPIPVATGCILGMLRASFRLFIALRDRRQISVASDGLFAHVFPAAEQEYCERDRDHCAQHGAKRPILCPVVAHHELRSSTPIVSTRPTPVLDRGS